MAIKWQGNELSFVCEVLCEIRLEVMRQRDGGRETVGETVGVETSSEVLNMWGAKVLAIAAVTKGALPGRLSYRANGAGRDLGKRGPAF